jgi:hypothetical protein
VPNIQAAVAEATPGAIIQFARGAYAMDATTQIVISVPRVTLQGHPRGTTIVGVPGSPAEFLTGDFLLNGGHQTVRRLNFRGFSLALSFGEPGTAVGGYRLEDCTFRNGDLPFDFVGFSDQVSTVRNNRFINVNLAFLILGKTVHFRGNSVSAPEPEKAPAGQPLFVGVLLPEFLSGSNVCENNVFERNRVAGISDGILLVAFGEERCRNNLVRWNTFVGQRVFVPTDGGTMFAALGDGVRRNLIEHNELRGSEGLGVIIGEGSHNRILGNKFSDLPGLKEAIVPFPGTAIFLGEPTTDNRVLRNEFEDVVNTVVALGTGNIIGRDQEDEGDGHQERADLAAESALRLSANRGPTNQLLEKLRVSGLKTIK